MLIKFIARHTQHYEGNGFFIFCVFASHLFSKLYLLFLRRFATVLLNMVLTNSLSSSFKSQYFLCLKFILKISFYRIFSLLSLLSSAWLSRELEHSYCLNPPRLLCTMHLRKRWNHLRFYFYQKIHVISLSPTWIIPIQFFSCFCYHVVETALLKLAQVKSKILILDFSK